VPEYLQLRLGLVEWGKYHPLLALQTQFQNNILHKSKLFLDQYLINQGNASKSMASDLFKMVQT